MLNQMEKLVLVGLCDEFITETNLADFAAFPRTGWAQTALDHTARKNKISLAQAKGYVSQLQSKGFIKLQSVKDRWGETEHYVTLLEPCKEIIEHAGGYDWKLK